MPKYSKISKQRLSTVNPKLQTLFDEVIKHVDIAITEGIRTLDRQKVLLEEGKSKTLKSKHLTGDAIDFVPYKNGKPAYDMKDCIYSLGIIKGIALMLDIQIRTTDWDGDNIISDEKFLDAVHVELI